MDGLETIAGVTVRRAGPDDLPAVTALLTAAGLPLADAGDWLSHFLLAEAAGRVVAVAGLEVHDDDGLLRSLAVVPAWRGRGLAAVLIRDLARDAAAAGVSRLYLLTEAAEGYFARHGFRRISRTEATDGVRRSVELRHACPDSAALMRRQLAPPPSP